MSDADDDLPKLSKSIRPVMLRYRSVHKGLTAWTNGRVLDFTVSNARIVCEHAFALDEDMEVQCRLPQDRVIVLHARVAWARPFGEQQFEYVVTFLTMDPSILQTMIGAVPPPEGGARG